MEDKIEKTVNKTIEALDRIGRFIDKYGKKIDKKQTERIAQKIKEIKDKINS